MIKQLSKHDTLMSPFITVKSWSLRNTDPQELVLTETTGSEEPVALEYLDYTINPSGSLNRDCNIVLEQQSTDLAISEEGISGSGKFFPDTELVNPKTGTFKRMVYAQTYRAFYNRYNNPLQIFGIDNIDFPLGQNDRYLANDFIIFTIPRLIFGERLQENSLVLYDSNFDDNILIMDDGSGNLIATRNLFSKIQEVRNFDNVLLSGSSGNYCGTASVPLFAPVLTAIQVGFTEQSYVSWTYAGSDQTDFLLERSYDSGSSWPVTSSLVLADSASFYYDDVVFGQTIWYRITAHNGIGYGPVSNVDSVYIDSSSIDSSCGLTGSILENVYGIQGYFDGMIANVNSYTSTGITWDGSFPLRTQASGSYVWLSAEINTRDIESNGMCMSYITVVCDTGTGVPTWQLSIEAPFCGNNLWRGTKASGSTPVGTYTFVSGGTTSPTGSLTIVQLPGTSSYIVGNEVCCL